MVRALHGRGGALADVRIAVNDASGVFLESALTDANGEATVNVPNDGSLTSFYQVSPGQIRVVSYFDIASADLITIDHAAPPAGPGALPGSQPMNNLQATLQNLPVGGSKLRVFASCAAPQLFDNVFSNYAVNPYFGCDGVSEYDFFFFVTNSLLEPIAVGYILDAPFFPGASPQHVVAMNAPATPLVLRALNVPPDAVVGNGVDAYRSQDGSDSAFYFPVQAQVDGSMRTFNHLIPDGVLERVYAGLYSDIDGVGTISRIALLPAALPATFDLDLEGLAFPEEPPDAAFEDGTARVYWQLDSAGPLGDAAVTHAEWGVVDWYAVAPAAYSGELSFPEPPPEFATTAPPSQGAPGALYYFHYDRPDAPDYASFIAGGFSSFLTDTISTEGSFP